MVVKEGINSGMDSKNIYFKNKLISGADLISFNVVSNEYSKDKNYVYYGDKILELSDSNTFERLDSIYYIDKNYIFKGGVCITPKINGFNLKYLVIDFNHNKHRFDYFKDGDLVYFKDKLMVGLDINSFKIIGEGYFLDKFNVYYLGIKIENSDPNTFEFLDVDQKYSKDKNNVYCFGKIIKKADSNSIKFLKDDFLIDNESVYFNGAIFHFKKADPKSFKVTSKQLAEDKNYLYLDGEAVEKESDSKKLVSGFDWY